MATVLIDPRLEAFVTEMTRKLQAHDHDRGEFGWRKADLRTLMRWLDTYHQRLCAEILHRPDAAPDTAAGYPIPDLAVVAEQAINTANLSFMLWDVMLREVNDGHE